MKSQQDPHIDRAPEPESVVVLRIPRAEKARWVRAARPGPLVAWIRAALAAAAETKEAKEMKEYHD
jgi:hypothetical protein